MVARDGTLRILDNDVIVQDPGHASYVKYTLTPLCLIIRLSLQENGKGFGWNIYLTKAFHAFFTLGLFGEHLFLA